MFCTVAAQQAGEQIIGTASHYDTYVLVECPKPWPAGAFAAKGMPAALRKFIKAAKLKRSVQFLCVADQRSADAAKTRVLIYEKAKQHDGFINGYVGHEFSVDSLAQVVSCVEAHWKRENVAPETVIQASDLLVCTHGMRDMCCARFGQPFCRQAKHLAKLRKLDNTRVWQVSHIGGHRFAPTVISLPDGRYYGRLTVESLEAITNRQGSIQQMQPVYRGWGLLPQPVQVLEQQLLLTYGWPWLDAGIRYRCQEVQAKDALQVELSVRQPNGRERTYQAILKRDMSQPYCVQASCSATVPTTFVKYAVEQCRQVESSAGLQQQISANSLISSH